MFISCDWGTSSFRIRLVDPFTHSVLAEVKSNQGIADVHKQWTAQAREEGQRFSFYLSVLSEQLNDLQGRATTCSLRGLPIIISGMASANIGMIELPYKVLPFAMDGSDLEFKRINPAGNFHHEVIVISGAKTITDVMRGEEIQLIGCDITSNKERLYIFPGTHSKHITVKNGQAIDFKTYMTGEFFYLLSHHSILSQSVQEDNTEINVDSLHTFEEGVRKSIHENLLHNAFLVRTNHLFGHYSKEKNYHFLSGLLIGTELKECGLGKIPLTLVGNELMRKFYSSALQILGNTSFEVVDVDNALVRGHSKVYQLLKGMPSVERTTT